MRPATKPAHQKSVLIGLTALLAGASLVLTGCGGSTKASSVSTGSAPATKTSAPAGTPSKLVTLASELSKTADWPLYSCSSYTAKTNGTNISDATNFLYKGQAPASGTLVTSVAAPDGSNPGLYHFDTKTVTALTVGQKYLTCTPFLDGDWLVKIGYETADGSEEDDDKLTSDAVSAYLTSRGFPQSVIAAVASAPSDSASWGGASWSFSIDNAVTPYTPSGSAAGSEPSDVPSTAWMAFIESLDVVHDDDAGANIGGDFTSIYRALYKMPRDSGATAAKVAANNPGSLDLNKLYSQATAWVKANPEQTQGVTIPTS